MLTARETRGKLTAIFLTMNTKKADWINPPHITKKTLHSIGFRSKDRHTLLFVVGESCEMSLSVQTDVKYGFLLLHTPEEYILIKSNEAEAVFGNTKTIIPISEHINKIIFRKEGRRISISSEDKTLLAIEKDAFKTSAAMGISTEGDGDVHVEVF